MVTSGRLSASLVLEGDMGVLQHRHALSCSSLGSLWARTALGLASAWGSSQRSVQVVHIEDKWVQL